MNNSYITIIKEKRTALSRKRIPLNQNGCTANFRIGVPFEQNLQFEITPASTDDREGLRDLADHWSNVTILADKGYVGKNMKQEMQEKNICLFALKRSNSKENWPKSVRQLIFKLRRRVETVFSQLSGQLNAERVLAKSFQGLCTRLVNKVLAYNLCIALNSIFGETCELGKIKKLIF